MRKFNSRIKKQINRFFIALSFLTRLPSPIKVDFSTEELNRASGYFPLIGWLIGGFAALVLILSHLVFAKSLAVLLCISATILLTGAFHEDGWADFCDAFGGGCSKEKILLIMKDSRIGTYGTVGLILILGLKYASLYELNEAYLAAAMISGHSLSRFMSISFMYDHVYVTKSQNSKVKHLSTHLTLIQLLLAFASAILPLIFFFDYWVFPALIPLLLIRFYFSHLLTKKIGGYTGDCLGAVQQISELSFYLSLNFLY